MELRNKILPKWEKKKKSKKVRELCWQGLPPSVRGQVWKAAVGNALSVTPELYDIFGTRARQMAEDENPTLGREDTVNSIALDLSRTFPQLSIFQDGGPYNQPLRDILEAYVCFRPDVGYVQGMSFIAAVLLLNLDEFDAYVVLANLLNRRLFQTFFRMDPSTMDRYYAIFLAVMGGSQSPAPELKAHLDDLGIHPGVYLLDWALTLYAKALPLDVASRIWDAYVLDGDALFFRAAVGLLSYLAPRLLGLDFEGVMTMLTHQLDNVHEEDLMRSIQGVKLSRDRYDELYAEAFGSL